MRRCSGFDGFSAIGTSLAVFVSFAAALSGADLPSSMGEEEFKRLLKDRFDQKSLRVAVEGLHCGEYVNAVPTLNYFHYAPGTTVSQNRQSLEAFDDRTFRGKPGTLNVTKVAKGEPVKVVKFYVRGDNIEFIFTPTDINRLSALDTGKASARASAGILGQTTTYAAPAFRFCFYFDKATTLAQANARDVVAEIEKYFVPEGKFKSLENAGKDIRIDPGMSQEEVVKKLGPPQKSITIGQQTLLKYADFTVVLKDGKVAEVKIN